MPGHTKVLNPRQVAFASFYIPLAGPGLTMADAYVRAGYHGRPNNITSNAIRISEQPIVKAELDRRRQLAGAFLEMSAQEWRDNAKRYFEKAWDTEDLANVGRALEVNAKALGLFDTKSESGSVELANRLLALLAQAGRPQLIEGRLIEDARAREGEGDA